MKLLVDMNLSPQWIPLLAGAGHDAVHWSSVGAANAPDTEIMRHALADERIVFTHDLDFTGILAATAAEGAIVSVDLRRARARVLPLNREG